jgi:hypothetical protein
LAERLNDPVLIAQAHHSLWATLEFGGDLVSALDHGQRKEPRSLRGCP